MKKQTRGHGLTGLSRQLLVFSFVLLFAFLLSATLLQASSPEYKLVRLHFKDQSQLQAWIDSGLDVWQVDSKITLASVTKHQLLALKAESFDLEFVPELARATFPACYRTYNDMLNFFQELKIQYPTLFQLNDVGDSWEKQHGLGDRDLYAVRLTSSRESERKPKVFLIAEHHAREIITPEIAMGFIDDLLKNYGQDPTVTWLLDNREVWVMPMANPDGYARATQAENWRKNTKLTATCERGTPPNSYGVDLNRNYGYEWGLPVGSSSEPCNLTYRGNAPFSEPETRAIRDLVRGQDFNVLVSLHSYGDLILYPWAHKLEPAPDVDSLSALATRMAVGTGYAAMQATDVGYLSSGDTADWSYGTLNIPSFTIEVGGMEDGFFWPACDVKGQLYQEIRPALMYAAMAAEHPYRVAGGPEAHQITVEVDEPEITVRAQVSDRWTGGDRIESVELFVDALGAPGTGIPFSSADGECNSEEEWMIAELDERIFVQFAGRRVPILVVAQDDTGKRGVPAVAWLDLRDYVAPQSQAVELWAAGAEEPTFEIKNGYVYLGPADNENILMTVRDGRAYRGAGTRGEMLYTLDNGQVRAGDGGPIIYTVQENLVYRGAGDAGAPLYRIDNHRLLKGANAAETVILIANVNLTSETMETACLLLPVLVDQRY